MAVVAIAISFLVIILSLVISSGFRKEMREGVSSLTGDIQLCSPAANMYDSEVSVNSEPAWLDAILAHKAVEKITPAIYRTGIVQSGEDLCQDPAPRPRRPSPLVFRGRKAAGQEFYRKGCL